jgi:hypothetical protein
MDQNTVQIWHVVGIWVIGVGAVSAVVLSLWFAYHQGDARLEVTAGLRLLATTGSKSQLEYCAIKVVNIGDRPLNINSVGWEAGWFKNRKYFIRLFSTPGFDDVPKVLHKGQVANFIVPLCLKGCNQDWIVRFPKSLAGDKNKPCRIKRLKVVVGTSVGQMFRRRIESNLVEKLLESYEAIYAN